MQNQYFWPRPGNELYNSIKQNPKIKVVGFYDNDFNLNGSFINKIKIYGKPKHIKKHQTNSLI